RPLLRRISLHLFDQKSDAQRTALRRRQCTDVVGEIAEQIAQGCERELALGSRGLCHENAEAAPLRFVEPRTPQRGLADPRLAFEQELPGLVLGGEKTQHAAELLLSPD